MQKLKDFLKHKRLGMLWREMTEGNIGTDGGGLFEGLTKFFDTLSDDFNDRFYRGKLIGLELTKEVKDGFGDGIEGNRDEIGKTVHPLSIHDKGKYFEVWFAIKDVSLSHHKKILEEILKRFDKLTWHPS